MPKPPLTSGPLDPLQELGRAVLLIDNKGSSSAPYQVTGVERIPALGRRGFIPLYIPTATVTAGYASYGGEQVGAMPAGSQFTVNPVALNLNPGALFQFRMLLRFVGTFPTGLSADDFDLQINYPQAVGHWQLQQVGGVINAAQQFALPADANVGSIQGTNQPLPAAYPALVNPFDEAYASEVFIWGQTPMAFTLINNGSAAVPNTAPFMIGLNVTGIRYDLDVWPQLLAPQSTRQFQVGAGAAQMAPPDTVLVPISAFTPTNKGGIG
ncbi:MAG TPA: hypothetical protein VMV23_05450 [Candidatus Nanopelagicaceae bacterium]|nr:hypothetical protein [Candidatus Nanopelagicaceae bacterium]